MKTRAKRKSSEAPLDVGSEERVTDMEVDPAATATTSEAGTMAPTMGHDDTASFDQHIWDDFLAGHPDRSRILKVLENTYWGLTNQTGWESKSTIEKTMIFADEVAKTIEIPSNIKSTAFQKLVGSSPDLGNKQYIDLDLNVAGEAFDVNYQLHPDDDKFFVHLEEQRVRYLKNKELHAPFFPVIQSSGYGKSRLVSNVHKRYEKNDCIYDVVYWSFGTERTFPMKNVSIEAQRFKNRNELQNALVREMALAIRRSYAENLEKVVVVQKEENSEESKQSSYLKDLTPAGGLKKIFVVDEASNLFKQSTEDGISYYRCLRRAFHAFSEHANWLFFVVMSTYSNVIHLSPGIAFDPSFKPYKGSDLNKDGPLAPFVLGSSFRIHNYRKEILDQEVTKCLEREYLFSMGRPLWHAIQSPTKNGLGTAEVLTYARRKLSLSNDYPAKNSITNEQALAFAASRLCIAISPVSMYAPSLIASHMGTAVEVSADRLSTVVHYPSEPILAIAARRAFQKGEESCLDGILKALEQTLRHGSVSKGFKGELVARLLNLLAMDRLMIPPDEGDNGEVKQVSLKLYLQMFARKNEEELIQNICNSGDQKRQDHERNVLNLAGLLDSADLEKDSAPKPAGEQKSSQELPMKSLYEDIEFFLESKVCFTHFVYLSKSQQLQKDAPLITHDLFRYAYRRTAAIIVEEGRKGIDRIIPLRIGKDKFVGLVIQDKNRASDEMTKLIDVGCEETHHKLEPKFFLSEEEIKTFIDAEVDMTVRWPSMLFAVGVDKIEECAAKLYEMPALRRSIKKEKKKNKVPFPCLVFTGLGFTKLMSDEANQALKSLRHVELSIEKHKREDVPITFGN